MAKNKLNRFQILFPVCYWVVVAIYFVTVRYSGLGEYAPPDLRYADVIVYSVIVGFFTGLVFGLFPLSRVLRFKRRKSFLNVVLISTGCHILFFMIVIFMASLYGNTVQFALSYVFSPNGLTVLFHLFMASLLYHFILQINRKFGPGVLWEYTLGKYFTPKEEERVFMFLDLKSSTHLAEKLEHVSYSRMVQDCYAELTGPLIHYKAQVYQYVGDEVVVSWKMGPLFNTAACYQFFYAFRERIQAKKDYFLLNYRVLPEFKAGVHCGTVTVAEVGEIKTEIAYHGDVLNTASRIQSLCNSCGKELLVSEAFLLLLPEKERVRASFVVDAGLRGKETTTKIYTLSDPGV